MKKLIVIAALLLIILSSVLAGTLANYTVTLDDIASGSVVGKEFIFMEDGTDTFSENIKIAPTETVLWQFAVKNYDGGTVSETGMQYDLTFTVDATPGKTAIDPLTVTIKDGNGQTIDTVSGTGVVTVSGDFPLSSEGQRDGYIVEIYWPSTDYDIDYAGDGFGTSVNVSAVATQSTSGGTSPDPEPDPDPDPDPDPEGDISVLYQAGAPWSSGGSSVHNISVTITNNTDQTITGWELEFYYTGDIEDLWNAKIGEQDTATGYKRITCPDNYNRTIEPGQSVSFGGRWQGTGDQPITSVTVNGMSASVECQYGVVFP